MSEESSWWNKPRNVSIVTDNDGWMNKFSKQITSEIASRGDKAVFCNKYDDILHDGVAIFLSCHTVADPEVLERNFKNLVVHASDLPKGRGWSPLTWQIIEGKNIIPLCLLEADDKVDAGPIIYRESLTLGGHELIDEIRKKLADKCLELSLRYLNEAEPLDGTSQTGESEYFRKRTPIDSQLDVNKTLSEQFNILRTVDNRHYPAFFDLNGYRYRISIEKIHDQ